MLLMCVKERSWTVLQGNLTGTFFDSQILNVIVRISEHTELSISHSPCYDTFASFRVFCNDCKIMIYI